MRATITIDKDTVNSEEEAVNFINKYGFVTLFPIKRIVFPNLYQATAGNREEKFDNAWKWADALALKKLIHYGKLVRKQVTLVSPEFFPYLYRLCREKTKHNSTKNLRLHKGTWFCINYSLTKKPRSNGQGKEIRVHKGYGRTAIGLHISNRRQRKTTKNDAHIRSDRTLDATIAF